MTEATTDLTTTPPREPSIMGLLEQAVKDPEFNADKLAKLIALKERVDATEAKRAFADAMFKFHASPPKIVKRKPVYGKNKTLGPQYHYADFSDVIMTVRPALHEVGIVATWSSEPLGDGIMKVSCMLRHSMGHEETSSMSGGPETGGSKNSIQGVGSSDSYLRRYTLLSVTGLVAEGDDTDGIVDDAKTECITDAEAAHLEVEMEKRGVTVVEFLGATKLSDVSEVLAKDYDRAITFIKKRGDHHARNS